MEWTGYIGNKHGFYPSRCGYIKCRRDQEKEYLYMPEIGPRQSRGWNGVQSIAGETEVLVQYICKHARYRYIYTSR